MAGKKRDFTILLTFIWNEQNRHTTNDELCVVWGMSGNK